MLMPNTGTVYMKRNENNSKNETNYKNVFFEDENKFKLNFFFLQFEQIFFVRN